MVGVALDEEGLDLDDLRRRHAECAAAGRPPKFLYVIPSFQNPSGISHALDRRRGLLDVARELDLLVVEDDPYGDLYFEAAPLPTLRSMDPERVLYLSSFSKILAPGLRTAFLIGPEEILAKVEIAKQSANLCGSGLDQRVILACLKRGLIEAQKERIRPYYRAKRDAMLQALDAGDAGRRALDAARAAVCSCGSPCPRGWTRRSCSRPRWRRASPTWPAGRSTSTAGARTRCG